MGYFLGRVTEDEVRKAIKKIHETETKSFEFNSAYSVYHHIVRAILPRNM